MSRCRQKKQEKTRADREAAKNADAKDIADTGTVLLTGDAVARQAFALAHNKKLANVHVNTNHSANFKMETVAARVLLNQTDGLADRIQVARNFREVVDLRRGGRNFVVLGTGRSGDETHQRYTLDPRLSPEFEKIFKSEDDVKNITAPTLVRFGCILWKYVSTDNVLSGVTEPWLMFPVVLQSTLAPSCKAGFDRGWPFPIAPETWGKVCTHADIWVDVKNDDNAQVNGAIDRHERSIIEDYNNPFSIHYRKGCNVHAMHNSFRQAWNKHAFTNRNYSFLKLIQNCKHCMLF